MKYGYMRIININEKEPLDKLLSKSGCEEIYTDLLNKSEEQNKLISKLKPSDEVIVNDLDHLGTSINDNHKIIQAIRSKSATLTILDFDDKDQFKDSTTREIIDDFIAKTLNYVIQAKQKVMLRNQREGIEEAKKAGKYKGGRPKYTDDSPEVKTLLKYARENPKLSVNKLCKLSGIKSRTTAYSILNRHGIKKHHSYEFSIEFKRKN